MIKTKQDHIFFKALGIYQQTNRIKNIIKIHDTYRELGKIHEDLNNLNKAIFYYEQSLQLAFESKYILTEAYPLKFYSENDNTLKKLILLVEKTKQFKKYSQWKNLEHYFNFNQYLKLKYMDVFFTERKQISLVYQWQKKLQRAKYTYHKIPNNTYHRDCEIREAKYLQSKREINKLISEMNSKYPKTAKLLQINTQELKTVYSDSICKTNPPTIHHKYFF